MMIEIRRTDEFSRFLTKLRDLKARARILTRVDRISTGNFGDAKSVGGGVSELRIDYGPGYRVYFARHGAKLVILLCAGNKKSQSADIELAKELLNELEF